MTSEKNQAKEDSVDSRHGCILYVENVTVSFDGFKALDGLNLYINDGELRCVIGPNGAGKTTMMDVITGKTRPDEGTVFFGQSMDLTQMTEYEIAHAGIGRKFQKPTVFKNHTVYENLELALHADKDIWTSLLKRLNADQKETIEGALETIGLVEQNNIRAGLLAHGQTQWLEIGMLLVQDPRLLLIDAPVAGMTHQETEQTAELLSSLAGKHSVVVVEHEMDFIRSIANRGTVLHEGRVRAEGAMEDVQNDPKVVEVYLGS